MLTLEQRKLRQRGLGSSDIPAILGLSKTPAIEIWRSKLEPIDENEKPNKYQMRGNRMEKWVAEWYEEETGFACGLAGTMSHHAYDWWMATPDRLVWENGFDDSHKSADRILEIKTRWQVRDWEQVAGSPTDLDAMAMRAQILWQLGVVHERFGISKCDLAVLSSLDDLSIATVERNAEEEKALFEICGAWWQKHIVERVPPDPDASEAYGKWLASLPAGKKTLEIKEANGDPLLDDLAALCEDYMTAAELFDTWEAKKQEFRNRLCFALRDIEVLKTPWGKWTYGEVKGHGKTDWEAVARRFMGMLCSTRNGQRPLKQDMIKACEKIVSEETKMTKGYRALKPPRKIKVMP